MTRQQLKDAARLGRSKGRREQGRFLVEGVRSVEAAVRAGAPLEAVLVTAEGAADARVEALLEAAPCEVHRVAARDLDRVADARTAQGVIAVSRSVVSDRASGLEAPALLLDGVQDPGNVGALVRTAAWFGVRTVVGDGRTADFETPKAVRASMGGIWDVALVRVPDLGPALEGLEASGVALWGADLGGTPVSAWAPGPRAALVMGSEAHGLSPAVAARLRAAHGGRVHVPGGAPREGLEGSGVESLNVVVAGGVLLARWLGG